MPAGYVPDAGDIVWLQFDSKAGHEQVGHRPAVVLSPASYNGRAGMIICCPTTTQIKGYPFEVPLVGQPPSVVLADQVKSQAWQAGKATWKGQVTLAELAEIRAKLTALIGDLRSCKKLAGTAFNRDRSSRPRSTDVTKSRRVEESFA